MQEINTKLLDILFLNFKDIKIKYVLGNKKYEIIEFEKIKNFSFVVTTCNTDIDHLAFNRRKSLMVKDKYCMHPLNLYLISRLFV